jgi:glycosyltransferase involved in cell wall biosynthesis
MILGTATPAPHLADGFAGRAAFMTDSMWFAWLLRPDVRQEATIGNHAAQREFVTWWLLDGAGAYPGGWTAPPEVQAVAMEPVTLRPGFTLPRLLRGLYRRRADLRHAYPLHDLENLFELLAWYEAHGAAELAAAPNLPPPFLAHTRAPSLRPPWNEDGTAVPRIAVRLFGDSADLQARFNPETIAGRQGLADWYRTQPHEKPQAPQHKPPQRCAAPRRRPRQGVNLIGYPRGEFGLGEDIRALARALDTAGIAYSVHELSRGSSARQNDQTLAARITDRRPYEVDILCQNAFDTARCHLDGSLRGGRSSDDRAAPGAARPFTIGYWPWELARLPPCWRDVYGLVDEVWAPSRFTFDAYAADRPGIVRLMPPAVVLDPALARTRAPRNGASPFTFLCPFDPNSFLARKNPQAALRAFQAAFPPDDTSVCLVLHMNSDSPPPAWLADAAVADPRCRLETGTLGRDAYMRRLAAADCLLSAHRAEGFGRSLAEAVLLGIAVLATGASGCLDFLEPDELVPWTSRLICAGEYPFGEGMSWAEPEPAALAEAMRRVRQAARPTPARRTRMLAKCDPSIVGARIARRLEEIFARRAGHAPGEGRQGKGLLV